MSLEAIPVAKMLTLQEVVAAARRNLADDEWDYVVGGAETESTLKRNRHALDRLAFRPRVLRDVSAVDTGATLLGHRLRMPVLLPPIGSLQVLHSGAAAAVAEAAGRFGSLSFLSSVSDPSLEEVAAASTAPKVYQLYLKGDRAWMDEHLERACAAGFDGLCLTVDTAVYSRRERDLLKRYVPASAGQAGDFG